MMKKKYSIFALIKNSLSYHENWQVGVIKKTIPDVPKPAKLTPFKKRKRGITVVGPAKNNQNAI